MLDFQHWPEATGLLPYLKKSHPMMKDVASTPFMEVAEAGSLRLRKYQTDQASRRGNPVLVLPSVINQPFVLDLLPEKSLIRHFLSLGHDVYMIDWGVPRSHESHLSFDTLLTVYVDYLIRAFEKDSDGQKPHVLGHCLGGTIGLMLATLYPQRFQSLSLITVPVNFVEKDKLSLWARHPDFDVNAFTEAYGNVPWAVLQGAFLALKPTQVLSKFRQYLGKSKDERYLRNFWAMESWSNDNVNLRASCFRVLLEELYQKNSLAEGTLTVQGRSVDLRDYCLPTFVLMAPQDHIVPVSSHFTAEMVPGLKNLEVVVAEGGHVGALLSGRSQKVVWPKLTEWMKNCES